MCSGSMLQWGFDAIKEALTQSAWAFIAQQIKNRVCIGYSLPSLRASQQHTCTLCVCVVTNHTQSN